MKKHTITLEFSEEFYAAFETYVEFIMYGSIEKFASDLIFSYVQDRIEEANRAVDPNRKRAAPGDEIPF